MTGEEFRQIRESLHLSREKLAQKLGVSSATITNAERAHAVKPVYERRLLELKDDAPPPPPRGDDSFDALAAYTQATKALATLYRMAKFATAPLPRPVGRPRQHTPLEPSRAATRPVIAAYMRRLQAEPDETERRALIVHWSLTTPESSTHLRTFVDALAVNDIKSADDPRITLPE